MKAGDHDDAGFLHEEEQAIRKTNARQPAAVPCRPRESVAARLQSLRQFPQRHWRTARPARGGWCHSARGLPSARLALPATIQPAVSPFFQEVSFDLSPRQDAGRIFTILRFTVIQLRALFCAEGREVGFKTFPKRIQQLEFFRCGEVFKVLRQMAHALIFILQEARIPSSFKRSFEEVCRIFWNEPPTFQK
jgi:hypothetical protein